MKCIFYSENTFQTNSSKPSQLLYNLDYFNIEHKQIITVLRMDQNQPQDRNSGAQSDSNTTSSWRMNHFNTIQDGNNPLDYIDRRIIIIRECTPNIQTAKENITKERRSQSDIVNILASTVLKVQREEAESIQKLSLQKILQKAFQAIDRIQHQVRSITFRFLHQRKITPRQAEIYYCKNILYNTRELFIRTLNQIRLHQAQPKDIEQYQQQLVKEFDEYLSSAIEASSEYYSRFLKAPITLKMQEAIQPVSRRPNIKADIIYKQNISLIKCIQYHKGQMINPLSSYSEFITKVIDQSWTVLSTKNEASNQNLADKYIKFIERIYASSQHVQYQRMVHQISKNNYNAEIQTLNLFLQILQERQLVKQVAVKEKGKGLEYAVSKIKFESVKYEQSKRNGKSQKEIVLQVQPLPTGWSQAKKLEMMQEWINELESIFDRPGKHILGSTFFKNVENKEISLGKEAKLKLIQQIENQRKKMKQETDKLYKRFRSVQGQLLKISHNQPCKNNKIGALGALSRQSMIDLMNYHLCILIHHLLLAGKQIETGTGKQHVSLVSFTPSTILSSKIKCNQSTFITILNTLTMLDQSVECLHKFKLLQVVNNFSEGSNSINIKFLLGETAKCSLELSFIENSPKAMHYSFFSHFLQRVTCFKFGAMAFCSTLLSEHERVNMNKNSPHAARKRKRQKSSIDSDKKLSSSFHIKNSIMFICIICQNLIVGDQNLTLCQQQTYCNNCIMKTDHKVVESYVASRLKINQGQVNTIKDQDRLQNCNVIGLEGKTLKMIPFKACYNEFQDRNQINVIDERLIDNLNRKVHVDKLNPSLILNMKEFRPNQKTYFHIKGQNLTDILRNLQIPHIKENINYFQAIFRDHQQKRQIRRIIEGQNQSIDLNEYREGYYYLMEYLKQYKLIKEERIKNIKYLLKSLHLPSLNLDNLDESIMMLNNLQKLDVRDNKLKNLDISPFRQLTHLNANHNELKTFQQPKNQQLSVLQLSMNQIRTISLNNNTKLVHIDLSLNKLQDISLTGNPILKKLVLSHNGINSKIDLTKCPQLIHLDLSHNQLTSINVQKNCNISYINLSYNDINEIDTRSLENLTTLIMSNAQLQKLDVSSNKKLRRLCLGVNNIAHLDLSNNPNIIQLNLDSNKLDTINLQNNYQLTTFSMQSTKLKVLKLTNNLNLKRLDLRINELVEIDLTKNTKLSEIVLNQNKIRAIDLSNNTMLNEIHLANNQLTQIDISSIKRLETLDIKNNKLTKIVIPYSQQAQADNFNLSQLTQKCLIIIKCKYQQELSCRRFVQKLQKRFEQLEIDYIADK